MSDTPSSDRPDTPVAPDPSVEDHPAAKALFGWVEAKSTGTILFYGVIGLAIALFAADLVVDRHDYLSFAETFGFYGFWGFGAFALAVLSGWPLGHLLRRDEDYYGEADIQPADVEHPDPAIHEREPGE
ncbi:MAG: hypothetical protein AAF253_10025 [Pseudomonadota bacterium]